MTYNILLLQVNEYYNNIYKILCFDKKLAYSIFWLLIFMFFELENKQIVGYYNSNSFI